MPAWERFPTRVQTGPWAHTASCTIGTGSFPAVKSGRGVTLTPHHLLVPWSRKSRAIPLRPLWAVRPVKSLSACTKVHFTLCFLFLHQLFFHPLSPRIAIYFLVYLSILLFPNSYIIPFFGGEFYFLPFSVHAQTNVIYYCTVHVIRSFNCQYQHMHNFNVID